MRYTRETVEVAVRLSRETIETDGSRVFFPENDSMPIREGYYALNDVVTLLRNNRNRPEVVQYIADMLEE